MDKQKIVELISQNRLDEAMDYISNNFGNEGVLLKSRYSALSRDKMMGIIDSASATIRENQIISSAFHLLGHEPQNNQSTVTKKQKAMSGNDFSGFRNLMSSIWSDVVKADYVSEFNEIISKFRHDFGDDIKGRKEIDFYKLIKEAKELETKCKKESANLFDPIKREISELLESSKIETSDLKPLFEKIDKSGKMTREAKSFYENINDYEGSKMEVRLLKEILLSQFNKF